MKIYAKKENFRHSMFDPDKKKISKSQVDLLAEVETIDDPFHQPILERNGKYYIVCAYYPKCDIILVEECGAIDPDDFVVGEGTSNESEAKCPVCGYTWRPETTEEDYDAHCGKCGSNIAVTPNVTVTYDVALLVKPDILHIGGKEE